MIDRIVISRNNGVAMIVPLAMEHPPENIIIGSDGEVVGARFREVSPRGIWWYDEIEDDDFQGLII
jgi:hypothetical protein